MPSKVIKLIHDSKVLKNNPLKDPHKRELLVYLPKSYLDSGKSYPVVYLIAGFTGFGKMNMNVSGYSENIQQRLDRLINTKRIGEMIVVMPDCFTRYGVRRRHVCRRKNQETGGRPAAASRSVAGRYCLSISEYTSLELISPERIRGRSFVFSESCLQTYNT